MAEKNLQLPENVVRATKAPKSYSQKRIDLLRDRLTQRLKSLAGNDMTVPSIDERQGEISGSGSMEYEQQIVAKLHTRGSREAAEILEALQRIQLGTHEVCKRCKQVIGWGRHEILPAACRCAACQEKFQKTGTDEEE